MPLLHVWGYLTMLVIVIHRHDSWLGLLTGFFSWHLSLHLFRTMRVSLQQGGLQVSTRSVPPVVCPKCVASSSLLLGLTFKFWEAIKGNISNLYCFGGFLNSPSQQLEKRFLMLNIEVLLDSLWLLGGALSPQVSGTTSQYIAVAF